MKACEVLHHFQKVGAWVNWNNTTDRFLHGNPDIEVRAIAAAWIATNEAIRQAAEGGANLFVTHEPINYARMADTETGQRAAAAKLRLLDECEMTVLRCHDTWDRMPGVGILDSWAAYMGFETEPQPEGSFYKICLVNGMTVEDLARRVLERVRPLGQGTVQFYGDRNKRVRRMAVGTGCINNVAIMQGLGADVLLATDDGLKTWDDALWAVDTEVPVLIVNHATTEKPGMQKLAEYLSALYRAVPVSYIDVKIPYAVVT
jgi:putative NIF3 family GTP cyclohydrolase 1 type 2